MPPVLQAISAIAGAIALVVVGWMGLAKDRTKTRADAAGVSVTNALTALNAALDRATDDAEDLRTQLSLARDEVACLQDEVAHLRRETNSLRRQLGASETELARLREAHP